MPLVRIPQHDVRTPAQSRQLADTVQDVMLELFDAPPGDRYQIIETLPVGSILAEDTGLGIERSDGVVIIPVTQQGRRTAPKHATASALAHRRPGTALAPPTNNHRYMSGQRIGPVGSWEHPPDRRAPPHTAAAAYGTDAGFRRREAWRPMAADLDIITFGRSGVDIYPLEIEKGLEDIHRFGKFLGGSPMNVAVAAARLGHNPGVITGV